MIRRKQQFHDAAERLDRVLQTPVPLSTDAEVTALAVAAQALAPSMYPRESWRKTMKDRMLREAAGKGVTATGTGSLDGQGSSEVHAAEVTSLAFGRATLADVEHISPQRAAEVAEAIALALGERVDTTGWHPQP